MSFFRSRIVLSLTEEAGIALTLKTCILEVLDSTLGRDTVACLMFFVVCHSHQESCRNNTRIRRRPLCHKSQLEKVLERMLHLY
jgi:hypothetical protein